jgi:hypothetical protein
MKKERELLGHVKERGERKENKMFYDLIMHMDFTLFLYSLGYIINVF